eukprot:scaffold123954_cov17-Tisochrysis_lutea.AAC.2
MQRKQQSWRMLLLSYRYGCCTIAVPVSLDLGMDKHPEGELLQASPVYIRKMVLADEPSI